MLPPQCCVVKVSCLGGVLDPPPSKGLWEEMRKPDIWPLFCTLLWLRGGEVTREGSAKAPRPTSPHSIRRSRPPEVTGHWGQPIAEELLIAESQWSREAELNYRLRGRLGHAGPWAPGAPPGSSRGAGRTPGNAFRTSWLPSA